MTDLQQATQLNRNHRDRLTELIAKQKARRAWWYAQLSNQMSYAVMIGSYIPLGFRDTCLELGAGDGTHQEFLEKLCANVWGVEILMREAARAAEQGHMVLWTSIEEMQVAIPEGRFGCVVSLHTMEHVYDLDKALENITRALRPGGYVAQATPTHKDREPAHICQLAPREWVAEYSKLGYTMVYIDNVRWYSDQTLLVMKRG